MAIAKLTPLGKVTVASAGTVQQVSSTPKIGHSILFTAVESNTGKIFIGTSTLNKSTGAGVIAVLGIPTTSVIPTFNLAWPSSHYAYDPADLYIDSTVNGEGVYVTVGAP